MAFSMSSNLSSPSNTTCPLSTLPVSPSESLQLSHTYMIVYLAIRVLWSLFSLAGNSLTLVAVFRFPSLQAEPANFLICNLAMWDLQAAVLPFLVVFHQMVLYGRHGYITACLVEKILSIMATRGNVVGLFMITFDRFISVAYPLRYHALVTPVRVWITLGALWAWNLIETPLVLGFTHRMTSHMTCKYFVFLPEIYRMYYIPQLMLFLIPTIILYAFIARTAIRQSRMIENSTAAVVSTNVPGTRKQRKVAKMMGLVLGAFVVTYIPSSVMGVMISRHQTLHLLQVEKVTTIIVWMGIWVNPLIYAWKSRDFRRAFRIILHLP